MVCFERGIIQKHNVNYIIAYSDTAREKQITINIKPYRFLRLGKN
uniref:Uncharacterized protein n=1 Tax=Manihot esculenta TaxID=3983 RepID=A0A2C9UK97_MANES